MSLKCYASQTASSTSFVNLTCYVVSFLDSTDYYNNPGMATVIFISGATLPAVECVAIATNEGLLLEGDHQFSAHVYNTSEVGSSLLTISSASSTAVVTIDGEKDVVKQ